MHSQPPSKTPAVSISVMHPRPHEVCTSPKVGWVCSRPGVSFISSAASRELLTSSFRHKRTATLTPKTNLQTRRARGEHRRARIICVSSETSEDDLSTEINKYLNSPRTPKEGPLSFEILKMLGRDDLMSAILDAGGSAAIAEKMGLDQNLFIPPLTMPKSTMLADFGVFQDGASVKVGRDLEERLKSIEQVQEGGGENTKGTDQAISYERKDAVLSPEEIQRMNDSFTPPIVDEPTPFDERLTLPASLRLGMIAVTMSAAVGFGRASAGVVPTDVQRAFQTISCGLVAAHVILAVYVGLSMAPSLGRSPIVWFAKVLLSGPIGVQYLRAAGSLTISEK